MFTACASLVSPVAPAGGAHRPVAKRSLIVAHLAHARPPRCRNRGQTAPISASIDSVSAVGVRLGGRGMRERLGVPAVLLACSFSPSAYSASPGTAAADSMTTLPSFSDPRGRHAEPRRPRHQARPATGRSACPPTASSTTRSSSTRPRRATNCWITDMVPSLVYERRREPRQRDGANLNTDGMMHHFVMLNRQAVRTRSARVGSRHSSASGSSPRATSAPAAPARSVRLLQRTSATWRLIYHLVNKAAVPKNVSIEIVYQYRTTGGEDARRCGWTSTAARTPSTPSPIGYSDTTADWTVDGQRPVDRHERPPARRGHHRPRARAPTTVRAQGHGIAVSAELVGGIGDDYYGPIPPNNTPPADLDRRDDVPLGGLLRHRVGDGTQSSAATWTR